MSISDCYFLENNANSSGAVFSYDYSPITYSECIFLNNTANYGSISGSYPLKLKFSNSTQKELHSNALQNMSTGTPISLNLEVEICDIDNQKINILNNGFIVVQLINIDSSDEIIYQNIKGRLEAAISNGSAIFNQLIIFAKPLNANLTLAFSSPLINQNLGKIEYNLINNSSNEYIIEKSYYFTIPTTLRQCIPGEIYDEKISSCATCPSNTYSLNPKDYKCNECPLSADCYGGMNLSLHRGYWRSGLYSSIILKCEPYLDSCL